MRKNKTNAHKQVELVKKGERKLRQYMGRPTVIPDKKKQQNKYACR